MNILVIFISHVLNDAIIDQYNYLKCACDYFGYDIIWCSPNKHLSHDEIEIVNLDIPDEIIHDKIANATAGHLYITPIYDLYHDYNYYWLIENDVTVNNDNVTEGWENLFKFYKNNDSDLISSKINKWSTSEAYQARYPLYALNKYNDNCLLALNYEKLWFCFIPVCRLSNKLLKYIWQYYNAGNKGYCEFVIASLAKHYDLKISSLSKDRFDIDNSTIHSEIMFNINRGSLSWTYLDSLNYKDHYPKNTLVHPIKLYE